MTKKNSFSLLDIGGQLISLHHFLTGAFMAGQSAW